MYCEICKTNPANIHYTRIINGQKEERHLCEDCAKKMNFEGQTPSFPSFSMMPDFPVFGLMPDFSMADFIGGFFNPQDKTQPYIQQAMSNSNTCPVCGMTVGEFKKLGQVGCMNCYEFFGQYMPDLLRRIHGSAKHVGKIPNRDGAQLAVKQRVQELRAQLKEVVLGEEFELAAKLRDEIKALENGEANGGGENA